MAGEVDEVSAGSVEGRGKARLIWLRPIGMLVLGVGMVVCAVPLSGYQGTVINAADATSGFLAVGIRFGGVAVALIGVLDALRLLVRGANGNDRDGKSDE